MKSSNRTNNFSEWCVVKGPLNHEKHILSRIYLTFSKYICFVNNNWKEEFISSRSTELTMS